MHPVVYPAAGSHATFYGPAVYVGHGADGSGVGCDNTTPPLHAVHPKPVLLPDDPQPGDPMAWLLFNGHWGELHGGISGDGPTGPMLKDQWHEPFTWMEASAAPAPSSRRRRSPARTSPTPSAAPWQRSPSSST